MDDIQLYCWSVFEKFCVPSTPFLLGTMDTFFKIMQWSFQANVHGGFGQIQTGQGACITTALLKVGKLELLWLEVILVCCCN